VKGKEVSPYLSKVFRSTSQSPFPCTTPSADAIRIEGSGEVRVIGLIPHQILTRSLQFPVVAKGIPDLTRDILKVVVCSRYRDKESSAGLVHGFSLKRGAIASSISHDAHNIIAVGTSDGEIQKAIEAVIRSGGGMVAVLGDSTTLLPLGCAGLMSWLPYPEVVQRLKDLHKVTESMGSITDPFMYLSFLALTVIPALRITDQGLFDVHEYAHVPLFVK
jgi:adenine deaminase